MQTIDIGINLTHRQFQPDREEVLQKAVHAGVSPLIMTGTSVRASEQAADYDRDFSPRDVQRRWFQAQIELVKLWCFLSGASIL